MYSKSEILRDFLLSWIIALSVVILTYVFRDSINFNIRFENIFSKSVSVNKNSEFIGKKICNRTFRNYENGLATTLTIKPAIDAYSSGSIILNQLGCDFIYIYSIKQNIIDATYLKSDCGRESKSVELYYDSSQDYIYLIEQGQKFIYR